MENVISELRVIETDDGFRIEIKGDKEKIRGWIGHWMEAKGRPWRGGPGHFRGHFPFGFAPWMYWGEPGKEEPETQA
ncbi:MAG: hypothetical protein AB1894_13125 [Chloroflexota bacterium]